MRDGRRTNLDITDDRSTDNLCLFKRILYLQVLEHRLLLPVYVLLQIWTLEMAHGRKSEVNLLYMR